MRRPEKIPEASYDALWLSEGDAFRMAAFHGDLPAAYIEQYGVSFRPSPKMRWPAPHAPLR
jgi:hypothetical protein